MKSLTRVAHAIQLAARASTVEFALRIAAVALGCATGARFVRLGWLRLTNEGRGAIVRAPFPPWGRKETERIGNHPRVLR